MYVYIPYNSYKISKFYKYNNQRVLHTTEICCFEEKITEKSLEIEKRD